MICYVMQEGVYVYGLYMDGGGWDRRFNRMCEPISKVLYCMMPVIHIYAINSVAPKDPKLYMVNLVGVHLSMYIYVSS